MNYMEWATKKEELNIISEIACTEIDFFIKTGQILGKGNYIHALQKTRTFEYPWIYKNIRSKGNIILDAGGGESPLQFLLSKENKEIYNIDSDKEAIERLQKQLPQLHRHNQYKNIHLIHGDISILPFEDNYFDYTYSISVLEHTKKQQIINKIQEMLRVTKKTVLITMDITLQKGENKDPLDLDKLIEIAETFDFNIPKLPEDILYGELEEEGGLHKFTVACLSIQP